MMITLGDECKRYANNFYIFESNLEIQRKTMVIRYEDLALNPMKYSRKVYKFLGVKFTESIEQMMKDAIEPPKKEIKDKGISIDHTRAPGTVPFLENFSVHHPKKIFRSPRCKDLVLVPRALSHTKLNFKMCLFRNSYVHNKSCGE